MINFLKANKLAQLTIFSVIVRLIYLIILNLFVRPNFPIYPSLDGGNIFSVDVPEWYSRYSLSQYGLIPYRDYECSFPPLGVTYILFLCYLSNWDFYNFVYVFVPLFNFGFGTLLCVLIYKTVLMIWKNENLAFNLSLLYTISPIVVYAEAQHHDHVAMFFSVLSLYFFLNKRLNLSAICLGCGIMLKYFPIFLFPLFIKYLYDNKSKSYEILQYLIITLLVCLFAYLPYFILSPEGILHSYVLLTRGGTLLTESKLPISGASPWVALLKLGAPSVLLIYLPFLVQLGIILFLTIQKYNSQEILVRLTTLSLFSITYLNRVYYLHYSMWFMALLFISYSKEFKTPTIILHLAWFLEIIAWGLPISLLRTILTYTYYLMIQVVSPIIIYLLFAEKPYNLITKLKLSKLLLIE